MASRRASSALCSRMRVASFLRGAPREVGSRADHEGKAAFAAATAAFASSRVASGTGGLLDQCTEVDRDRSTYRRPPSRGLRG